MATRVTKEDIRRAEKVNLIDAVIESGERYRRGHNLIQIICPFHNEKTPSMTIYEHSFFSYCCQEHGNTIIWIQKVYKKSFIEAVQILVEIANEQNVE
jgi:DNA primase